MKTTNIRMQRNTEDTSMFDVIAKSGDQELVHIQPTSFKNAKALLIRAKDQELTSQYWIEYIKPVKASTGNSDAKAAAQYAAYAH